LKEKSVVTKDQTNANTVPEYSNLAGTSETVRTFTCWASKLLSTPETAAKNLVRSCPKWQAIWKNRSGKYPQLPWKNLLRKGFQRAQE
jgi:hypothetical protein